MKPLTFAEAAALGQLARDRHGPEPTERDRLAAQLTYAMGAARPNQRRIDAITRQIERIDHARDRQGAD